MHEDRTQNYDSEIHEEYLTHGAPFTIARLKGGFFAVTVSLKSGFFYFSKNLKKL